MPNGDNELQAIMLFAIPMGYVLVVSCVCLSFAARAEPAGDALAKGRELHGAGKFQEAVNVLDEAIRLDANLAEAYFLRGDSFTRLGKHDRPFDDFSAAIRLKPDYA